MCRRLIEAKNCACEFSSNRVCYIANATVGDTVLVGLYDGFEELLDIRMVFRDSKLYKIANLPKERMMPVNDERLLLVDYEYDHWLYGLEEAAKWGLENEYNYCYFKLNMTVEEAMAEWDI